MRKPEQIKLLRARLDPELRTALDHFEVRSNAEHYERDRGYSIHRLRVIERQRIEAEWDFLQLLVNRLGL